ncbi:hypothetical protein ACH4UT_34300 [Streptomyces sp. NPDC020799]|uniref:hypothetical protein n=1 Tax=Streptomyces sp. NPDC020799 TaxID=3365091 RepID=UPI00379BB666
MSTPPPARAAQGTINTYAGIGGTPGYNGDGPATSVLLNEPDGVFATEQDVVIICDRRNQQVRKVDTGTPPVVTKFAGTGAPGNGGDGQATSIALNQPMGPTMDAEGNLYFCDYGNDVVRKVDTDTPPLMTRFAGNGSRGFSGDGGSATDAQLNGPVDAVFDQATRCLYFAEWSGHVVRVVDSAGIIKTIAGIPGSPGFSGDGGRATDAQLNDPTGLALDGNGKLFVCDRGNGAVRVVQLTPPAVFVVEQGAPDPVFIRPGTTAQLAFTVSSTPAVDGQTITLALPEGIAVPSGGHLRYICPGVSNEVVFTNTTGAPVQQVTLTGRTVTPTKDCFYSADVQATTGIPQTLQGTVTAGGTTAPVNFTVSPYTFTVEQGDPDPVPMRAGELAHLAFTVSAGATLTGQSVTLSLPDGIGVPPGGIIHYVCPGVSNEDVFTNTTSTPVQQVTLTGRTVTPTKDCFYSADLKTTLTTSGTTHGTVTIAGTTQPVYFRIG